MSISLEDEILRSLRRLTRAIDLHSKRLATTFGLTGPQLVCLSLIEQLGEVAPGRLAKEISLSPATVTGIVDRLSARQLVTRERSLEDRRRVSLCITEAGRALLREAPSPLQERFVEELEKLPGEDQERIRDTLEQVVQMMGGEDLDVAPVLSAEPIP